jgi:hypothetical protein
VIKKITIVLSFIALPAFAAEDNNRLYTSTEFVTSRGTETPTSRPSSPTPTNTISLPNLMLNETPLVGRVSVDVRIRTEPILHKSGKLPLNIKCSLLAAARTFTKSIAHREKHFSRTIQKKEHQAYIRLRQEDIDTIKNVLGSTNPTELLKAVSFNLLDKSQLSKK